MKIQNTTRKIEPIYKTATKEQNKVVKKPKEVQDKEPSRIDLYA